MLNRMGKVTSVTSALALREHKHRQYTLLAIASLLLMSTSPVLVHHLPVNLEAALDGMDHLGAVCVTALHLLFEPIHDVFHVFLAAGILYAAWDRARSWYRVRHVLAALDARPPAPGDPFWRAARRAGLEPRALRIVDGLPSPAFTVGLLSPRVYVAEALLERLSDEELVAVLAHESAHVERRDPLRLSVLRALAHTLFWIPALERLADDMADEAEVLADDVAAADRPLVLAQAILTLAQWPRATAPSASAASLGVGFNRPDLLDRRVRRLVGEETPPRSHVTRRSIVGAFAALVLVWSSGVLMAHPMPANSSTVHERHCDHRHESALAHLFCLGSPLTSPPTHCPHLHEG